MKWILSFCLVVFSGAVVAAPSLPDSETRIKIIESVANEMSRLDGEALFVRRGRSQSWENATAGLYADAIIAQDWPNYIRAFQKLDQAYPNLHANLKLGPDFDGLKIEPVELKISFMHESYNSGTPQFLVNRIDSDVVIPKGFQLEMYDEVVAINGRSMADWRLENFEFCKFALQTQCDEMLYSNLRKGFLSWKPGDKLVYSVKHFSRKMDIAVEQKSDTQKPKDPAKGYCKEEKKRYNDFTLSYAGNRACIYQRQNSPMTAILRITSFDYSNLKAGEKLNSVETEVAALYDWWKDNSNLRDLIIDVIDNTGGAAPTDYLKLILQKDFQQVFLSYKKIKEMDDPSFRKAVFWESKPHELWFQKILASGEWAKLHEGDFTSISPMFCADETKDCTQGLFKPFTHSFYGQVLVMLNQFCVSACDDFVSTLSEQLDTRVEFYGLPNAADSAYSRAAIQVYLDPKAKDGFRIEITPEDHIPSKDVFLTQTVVISRSMDSKGKEIAGVPVTLKSTVSKDRWNQERWPQTVLETIGYY